MEVIKNMKKIKSLLLPFFYGVQNENNNGGISSVLPFSYYYDEKFMLYTQQSDNKLRNILRDIYINGSMLNGEMNLIDGGHQGRAALEFIYQSFDDFKNKRVLEIGCGNGFILKELVKKDAICVGLEPGPQIEEIDINNRDIELINDFFPSPKITGKFDLILHFNVLEHLENPLQSLVEQSKLLNDFGKIIFGMPNSEPNLKSGDISIFTHEHFSYFTRDSFIYIAKELGLIVDSIKTGASNGMIFCSFVKSNSNSVSNCTYSGINWGDFDNKTEFALKNLKKKIEEYSQKDVAIYCPKRALNALSIINFPNVRLIDDTLDMYGKYMPFFTNKIENFNSLLDAPPKSIFIFSRTFGNEILNKCREYKILKDTQIFLLEEFD